MIRVVKIFSYIVASAVGFLIGAVLSVQSVKAIYKYESSNKVCYDKHADRC